MSQTLAEAAGWAGSAPILHFVNLRETEAEREQPVLLAHRPRAGKAEALAQPQHRFKPLDRTPRRVEGLQAAHPRHGPLDPEVVALDPLLSATSRRRATAASLSSPRGLSFDSPGPGTPGHVAVELLRARTK